MGKLSLFAVAVAGLVGMVFAYGRFIFWQVPGPLLLMALLVLALAVLAFLQNDVAVMFGERSLRSPLERTAWAMSRDWIRTAPLFRNRGQWRAARGGRSMRGPTWMKRPRFPETELLRSLLFPTVVAAGLVASYFAVGPFIAGQSALPMLHVLSVVLVASIFGVIDRDGQLDVGRDQPRPANAGRRLLLLSTS